MARETGEAADVRIISPCTAREEMTPDEPAESALVIKLIYLFLFLCLYLYQYWYLNIEQVTAHCTCTNTCVWMLYLGTG